MKLTKPVLIISLFILTSLGCGVMNYFVYSDPIWKTSLFVLFFETFCFLVVYLGIKLFEKL